MCWWPQRTVGWRGVCGGAWALGGPGLASDGSDGGGGPHPPPVGGCFGGN